MAYDSNLDELENLLRDLDGRKSVAPTGGSSARKQQGKSEINFGELDDIIGDLDPSQKSHHHHHQNQHQHQHNQHSNPPRTAASVMMQSNPTPNYYGEPPTNRNTMDNIDDLLKGLEQPSRSARPVSVVKHNDNKPFAYNNNQPNNVPVPAQAQSAYARPANPPANSGNKMYVAKPATVKAVQGDDLNNLLEHLTSSAAVENNVPHAKGSCAACGRNILGEVISALGRNYHPEHFQCGNCRTPLGTNSFFEQDGVPHCEKCYQELLCPRCAHCDEAIMDRCITAIGRKWHMHHFICTQCLSPFGDGSFFERDNRPYCQKCFSGNFNPRCAGCNQPINGEITNALGQQWHPEHFVCQYCQKSFVGGSYFEFGGKPYCDVHYHQQTGSLCAGCGKAVTGKCVDALGKRWHPEHFVCAFCMNPLEAGHYQENAGKAYDRTCYGKLFG